MSAKDTKQHLLASIPDLTEETLLRARREWTKHNPMRQSINVLAAQRIEVVRNKLETCKPEELVALQQSIAATREFLAVINAEGEV